MCNFRIRINICDVILRIGKLDEVVMKVYCLGYVEVKVLLILI